MAYRIKENVSKRIDDDWFRLFCHGDGSKHVKKNPLSAVCARYGLKSIQ